MSTTSVKTSRFWSAKGGAKAVTIFLLLLMTLVPCELKAQATNPADCRSALCEMVHSGQLPGLRWPDFSDHQTRVQDFYRPANYSYAWIRNAEATPQAKALIEILRNSDAKGLNPEEYDVSQ